MVFRMPVYTVISMLLIISGHIVRGDVWEVPEACQGKTFCTERPDYYDRLQGDIDNKASSIGENFNFNYFPDLDADENPSDFDDRKNCPSTTEIIKPYTVMLDSTTRVIIQSQFFEQKIKQTQCAFQLLSDESSEGQCFNGISTTIKGQCKQKETHISLYLYNNDTQTVERIPVPIPVCCYCDISE